MLTQTVNASDYFRIPKAFRKDPVVVVPVVEEPIHFCENSHMDELCEIIERDEITYTVFASIVEHASDWKQ